MVTPSPEPSAPRDLSSILSYASDFAVPFTNAWTDRRIEQVNAYKHWVYIAISTIAKTVAAQAPNVSYIYTKDTVPGESRPRCLSLHARRRALTPLLTHQEIVPADPEHPLCRLLADPNDPDTSWDLWYETILFLLLTGSTYWYMPRDGWGLPAAIWVIPSHWMWPIFGRDRLIDAWEIRPVEGNYLRRVIPAEEIVQFRLKNPISKIDGHAPTSAGAEWIDIHSSVNRAKTATYKNGTFPTVSVQFDGKLQEPSDEDLRRIEAKFIARYVGENRSNKPLFLPPGVAVKPLIIEPNKMVFGETSAETRDNILFLFGVQHLIPDNQSKLSSGNLQAGFHSGTINPLFRFLGQTITEKIAWLYERNLRTWWEDTTPLDPEILERQLQTDMMAGAVCPDEIRILRGREPYDENVFGNFGKCPVFPSNMTTLPMGGAHQPTPLSPVPVAPQPHVSDETSGPTPLERIIFGDRFTALHSRNGHA